LGLFVVWQLVFLLVINLFNFAPWAPARVDEWDPLEVSTSPLSWVGAATRGWSGLTLQREHWGMFQAPPPYSAFPTVQARTWTFDERPLLLRSPFEPDDPYQYWFADLFADRVTNYELWLAVIYVPWDEATLNEEPAQYQEAREFRVRAYSKPLLAYVQWRTRRTGHSGPQGEAVFGYRVYQTPRPGSQPWQWTGPLDRPLVRFHTGQPADQSPLKVYDPRTRRFTAIPAQP
jgi:hypothetical protein